jgi:hypothetical protein
MACMCVFDALSVARGERLILLWCRPRSQTLLDLARDRHWPTDRPSAAALDLERVAIVCFVSCWLGQMHQVRWPLLPLVRLYIPDLARSVSEVIAESCFRWDWIQLPRCWCFVGAWLKRFVFYQREYWHLILMCLFCGWSPVKLTLESQSAKEIFLSQLFQLEIVMATPRLKLFRYQARDEPKLPPGKSNLSLLLCVEFARDPSWLPT